MTPDRPPPGPGRAADVLRAEAEGRPGEKAGPTRAQQLGLLILLAALAALALARACAPGMSG